jgi:hypothetical protein
MKRSKEWDGDVSGREDYRKRRAVVEEGDATYSAAAIPVRHCDARVVVR